MRIELTGWCVLAAIAGHTFYVSWQETRLIRWSPPGFVSHEYQGADGIRRRYVLYVPHESECGARLPLVVFLHDISASGADGREQLKAGLAPVIDVQGRFPCFVLFPQARRPWCTDQRDSQAVNEMIQRTIDSYRVDAGRVYLTGSGNGADELWDLAAKYPRRWAGVVLVSSVTSRFRSPIAPIDICWYYSRDDDLKAIREAVASIPEAVGTAKLVEFDDVGAGAWSKVYADPMLLNWLQSHHRIRPLLTDSGLLEKAAVGSSRTLRH